MGYCYQTVVNFIKLTFYTVTWSV